MYRILVDELTARLVVSEVNRAKSDVEAGKQRLHDLALFVYWRDYVKGAGQQHERLVEAAKRLRAVCAWDGVQVKPTADFCKWWRGQPQ